MLFILENYSAAPRPRDSEQLTELVGLEQDALQKLRQVVDADLAKLNKALADAGVPFRARTTLVPTGQYYVASASRRQCD